MQPDDVIGPETAVNFQRSEGHRPREIWRRFSGSDRKVPVAHAVAVGLIDEESLSPEAREHIASMVEFFRNKEPGA